VNWGTKGRELREKERGPSHSVGETQKTGVKTKWAKGGTELGTPVKRGCVLPGRGRGKGLRLSASSYVVVSEKDE